MVSVVAIVTTEGTTTSGKNWFLPEERKEEISKILTELLGDALVDAMISNENVRTENVVIMPKD